MDSLKTRRYKPDLVSDRAVVVVKNSLTAVRGLRDALTSLAMELAEQNSQRGYLLLLDPGLSQKLLESELYRFKAVMRSDLSERLQLVLVKDGKVVEDVGLIREEDRRLVEQGIRSKAKSHHLLPPASKQDEVILLMLHEWVMGKGPRSLKWLENAVGCHYRTVASAVAKLGPAVRRPSGKSIALKCFPEQEWARLLANTDSIRSTMLYSDASGQPRSPESLMRRLQKLNRDDVAIGGVPGVKHYFNNLDIIGAPRLDLCIHSPKGDFDQDIAGRLDPALKPMANVHSPARLAIHFIRRKDPLFDVEPDGFLWADPVECLLELYHARLDIQAKSFQEYLAMQGRTLSEGI